MGCLLAVVGGLRGVDRMAHRHYEAKCDRALGFEALEPRLALSGTGLVAQYFHNADFTGLADTRVQAVNHNWGSGSPGMGLDADSFSVRWSGQVQAEFSQTYTFRVLSDERARVWVDGQLLIDDWAPHVRRFQSGTIALAAGQKYDIRVDYADLSGVAQIELSWSSASQPLEIIPAANLFESPAGLPAHTPMRPAATSPASTARSTSIGALPRRMACSIATAST